MIFTFKRGDLEPPFECILMIGGKPANLSGATLTFRMRRLGETTTSISATAVIDGAPDEGHVKYAWAAGETDVKGRYQAEVVAVQNGRPRTWPRHGFIDIEIVDNLAGEETP